MSEDLSTLLKRIRCLRARSQYLSAEVDRVNREANKLMTTLHRQPSCPPDKGDTELED